MREAGCQARPAYSPAVLAVALLAAIRSSATEYPYSVVPGGVPADHVLAHDQCLYLGMRFGGQMLWTDHCVWLRAGEKMAGRRRARCGNPTALDLPAGAKTLPPGLHFLVPIMEKPLPNIMAPSPTTLPATLLELTWTPPGEEPQVRAPPPDWFLPIGAEGPRPCCKPPPPCKKAHGCLKPTPEPSGAWLLLSGLMGLAAVKSRRAYQAMRMQSAETLRRARSNGKML